MYKNVFTVTSLELRAGVLRFHVMFISYHSLLRQSIVNPLSPPHRSLSLSLCWSLFACRRFARGGLCYVRLSADENSDKVLSVFDGALQKAAVSSLTERATTLIERGLIEASKRRVCCHSPISHGAVWR